MCNPVMYDSCRHFVLFRHSNGQSTIEAYTFDQDGTYASCKHGNVSLEEMEQLGNDCLRLVADYRAQQGNEALDKLEKPEPGQYSQISRPIPWEETAAAALFGGLLDIGTENM